MRRAAGPGPPRARPSPVGPPIERIADDVRRIAAPIEALPPRAPRVRRDGTLLAYDDALSAACRALGLDDGLLALPLGAARDARRLRIECELECAGFVIRPRRAA